MVEVRTISEAGEHDPASSCIYYPLWFARFTVSWRRLLLSDRREDIWVCVDGVRGVAQRADVFPHMSRQRVSESDVLPLGISREGALDKARALSNWWARTRFFTWWAPTLEYRELHLLHKVYLIEHESAGISLRDSITGEKDFL